MRVPQPAVASVVSFIDAINCGAIDRLGSLLADDHLLCVLDEAPLSGKAASIEAWRGYTTWFPEYVIHPQRLVERAGDVVVLGHTTGLHLGLPDDEEIQLAVIWRACVRDGLLTTWEIIEDTPAHRVELGLTTPDV